MPRPGALTIRRFAVAVLLLGVLASDQGTGMASDQKATPVDEGSGPHPSSPTQVYRSACMRCHDSDGRGEAGRVSFPTIPDFTSGEWHASRDDQALSRAIVQGKGKAMRPMKKKLGSLDVTHMVSFVRAFRGGGLVVLEETETSDSAPDNAGALARDPKTTDATPTKKPVATGDGTARQGPRAPVRPEALSGVPADATPPAAAASPGRANRLREAAVLYRTHCASCHGLEGNGSAVRASMPEIPDFSAREWQAGKDSARLAVSILEGKGKSMPAWRDRIGGERVRDLVDFVRTFGPPGLSTAGPPASDFAVRFRRLRDQWEDLEQQIQVLSRPSSGRTAQPTDGRAKSTPVRR